MNPINVLIYIVIFSEYRYSINNVIIMCIISNSELKCGLAHLRILTLDENPHIRKNRIGAVRGEGACQQFVPKPGQVMNIPTTNWGKFTPWSTPAKSQIIAWTNLTCTFPTHMRNSYNSCHIYTLPKVACFLPTQHLCGAPL